MQDDRGYWAKYYRGGAAKTRYARAYSFSDRARYYLGNPQVDRALHTLLENLDGAGIPLALLSQYMPGQYQRVHAGILPLRAADLLIDHVGDCIDDYLCAVLSAESKGG